MVRADSHGISRAPCYSGVKTLPYISISVRGCHALWLSFPEQFSFDIQQQHKNCISCTSLSHNPYITTHTGLHDISLGSFPFAHHYWGNHFVFFSWHYLDVSVHAVRLFTLCIQIKILWFFQSGFLHSEIFGSMLDWQLPEAFGSLPPPSSPLDAKASTKCPFKLITNLLVTH
jgi:hypothetical protein